MAAISIPAGRWADRADPRATLLLSMIGIGVASVLGPLAPSFELLLASRVLQGAAAGLVVVYMPIVTAAVREAQPGRAIGFVITIMTVGGMAGMPLGGLVAGALSWRQVFLIKLPLLVVVFWLGYRSVPGTGRGLPRPSRLLVTEAVLLGAAVTAMLLAFDQLARRPWPESSRSARLDWLSVVPSASLGRGAASIALAGSAVSVVALLAMLTITADAGLAELAWRLALLGIGGGLFNTPINTAVLAAAPIGMAGTAGGIGATARMVAMTLGSSVAALCWTVAGGGLPGFRTGVLLLTAAALVGVLVLMRPRRA